jgi:putative oxidoreductase
MTGYGAAVAYFGQTGVPVPPLVALIEVMIELGVGSAIAIGLFTRSLAVLLALYTLATAIIGHHD